MNAPWHMCVWVMFSAMSGPSKRKEQNSKAIAGKKASAFLLIVAFTGRAQGSHKVVLAEEAPMSTDSVLGRSYCHGIPLPIPRPASQ